MQLVDCLACGALPGLPCTERTHPDRETRQRSFNAYYREVTDGRTFIQWAAPDYRLAPLIGFEAVGAMAELILRCAGTSAGGRTDAWQRGYDLDRSTYERAAAEALREHGDRRVFPDERGLLAQRFLENMPSHRIGSRDFYRAALDVDVDEYPLRGVTPLPIAEWLAVESLDPASVGVLFRSNGSPLNGETTLARAAQAALTSGELHHINGLGGKLDLLPLIREGFDYLSITAVAAAGITDIDMMRRILNGELPVEYARIA